MTVWRVVSLLCVLGLLCLGCQKGSPNAAGPSEVALRASSPSQAPTQVPTDCATPEHGPADVAADDVLEWNNALALQTRLKPEVAARTFVRKLIARDFDSAAKMLADGGWDGVAVKLETTWDRSAANSGGFPKLSTLRTEKQKSIRNTSLSGLELVKVRCECEARGFSSQFVVDERGRIQALLIDGRNPLLQQIGE